MAVWILSGTTRVSQYQKKHSLTHTYRGHQSSLICFLQLLQSMASYLFNLCAWHNLCPSTGNIDNHAQCFTYLSARTCSHVTNYVLLFSFKKNSFSVTMVRASTHQPFSMHFWSLVCQWQIKSSTYNQHVNRVTKLIFSSDVLLTILLMNTGFTNVSGQ